MTHTNTENEYTESSKDALLTLEPDKGDLTCFREYSFVWAVDFNDSHPENRFSACSLHMQKKQSRKVVRVGNSRYLLLGHFFTHIKHGKH